MGNNIEEKKSDWLLAWKIFSMTGSIEDARLLVDSYLAYLEACKSKETEIEMGEIQEGKHV